MQICGGRKTMEKCGPSYMEAVQNSTQAAEV